MSRRSVRKRNTVQKTNYDEGDNGEYEYVPVKQEPGSEYESDNDNGGVNAQSSSARDVRKSVEKTEIVSSEDQNGNIGNIVSTDQPLWKRKKRKKKVFLIDEEEEAQPTDMRKTENGGYAHTNLSKSRISKANKGNKPWNFGRRRSSADRAKIAAGVRARNRSILLQKLKHLGLTEEEYMQKKKEIKYLRERIRRAKKANVRHLDNKIHEKLQEALDATNLKSIKLTDDETKAREEQPMELKKTAEEEALKETTKKESTDDRAKGLFPAEINWRPFQFSDKGDDYDQSCPTGGPGGLICCEHCSTKFNTFLTMTSEDMETFRMKKESAEVTEISDFLKEKKDVLKEAINCAKVKIPPLPPPGAKRLGHAELSSGSRRSSTNGRTQGHEMNIGWDLTSTVDLGSIGDLACV